MLGVVCRAGLSTVCHGASCQVDHVKPILGKLRHVTVCGLVMFRARGEVNVCYISGVISRLLRALFKRGIDAFFWHADCWQDFLALFKYRTRVATARDRAIYLTRGQAIISFRQCVRLLRRDASRDSLLRVFFAGVNVVQFSCVGGFTRSLDGPVRVSKATHPFRCNQGDTRVRYTNV